MHARSRFARGTDRLAGDRLAAAIREQRARMAAQPPPPPPWRGVQGSLLQDADAALACGRFDRAWRFLHATSRLDIGGLAASALHARATTVREEANSKLHGWRRDVVGKLLHPSRWPDPAAPIPPGTEAGWRILLAEAEWILHGHFDNMYHKIRILRHYLLAISVLLAVAWAACMVAAAVGLLVLPEPSPRVATGLLLTWSALGLLGGAFSGALSMLGTGGKGRIPEQLAGGIGILVRAGAGTVSGMAAGILWSAGLIPVGGTAGWAPLALAFAAGFSERLVVRAMGSASGEAK